jgi:hypothetical protein
MTDGDWSFGFTRTRQGTDEGEVGAQDLSKEVVLGIYRHVVGPEPSIGLDVQQILDNWDRLEPALTGEIGQRVQG